jgi:hypothetical protein
MAVLINFAAHRLFSGREHGFPAIRRYAKRARAGIGGDAVAIFANGAGHDRAAPSGDDAWQRRERWHYSRRRGFKILLMTPQDWWISSLFGRRRRPKLCRLRRPPGTYPPGYESEISAISTIVSRLLRSRASLGAF